VINSRAEINKVPGIDHLERGEPFVSARIFAALALGAGLVLNVAACSDAEPSAVAEAPASTPASAPTSAISPTPAKTTQATPTKTTTKTAPTDQAGSVCPVSEKTLLATVEVRYGRKNLEGTRLTNIVCYQGYAIAGHEPPGHESEMQTYQYASGSWKLVHGTNDGFCYDIPTDIRKYFGKHGYPNCPLNPTPA
jgi:hypothetical protein